MITELKSIITLASTWVVVVKNDTEVCMYSILLSGFIEVKPALTPLSSGVLRQVSPIYLQAPSNNRFTGRARNDVILNYEITRFE